MFDMNQCKPGDKLISKHGMTLTYIAIDESAEPFIHIIQYPDGSFGSRSDDGQVFIINKQPGDHDIIGFA